MLITSAPTTVGITGDSLWRRWASVLGAEMALLFRTERVLLLSPEVPYTCLSTKS